MQLHIIGAGAVGLLFASYGCQAGLEVTLHTKSTDQANLLNNKGLVLEVHDKVLTYPIKAEKGMKTIDSEAIVIIAVKQYNLAEVLSNLGHVKTIIFVQNGMSHISYLENVKSDTIFLAVVEHGTLKKQLNRVTHTGIGKTKISIYKGQDNTDSVVKLLEGPNFPIDVFDDWYRMLAEKLIVNAVINPLTAIYRVNNGSLLKSTYLRSTMRTLWQEANLVLNLSEESWENVLSICEKTAENRSSMLRDIENGTQTEIDAISGYLLSVGEKISMSLPVTSFVYESVKGLEQLELGVGTND